MRPRVHLLCCFFFVLFFAVQRAQTASSCDQLDCGAHGSCSEVGDMAACFCFGGYSGATCQSSLCDSSPCHNHATCIPSANMAGADVYSCSCTSGWFGTDCSQRFCDSSPCYNLATCDADTSTCTCSTSATTVFSGEFCQTATYACQSDDGCYNGATCVTDTTETNPQTGRDVTTCICAEGYSGPTCNVGPCDSNPCNLGGTCELCVSLTNPDSEPDCALGLPYFCKCPPFVTGPTCGTLTPCLSSPCQNLGTCIQYAPQQGSTAGVTFQCYCLGMYTGELCETRLPLPPGETSCEFVDCHHGGSCAVCPGSDQCTDENNIIGWVCLCAFDWTGSACLTNPSCDSSPCANGGSCIGTVDLGWSRSPAFTCHCLAGFSGVQCETLVNFCEASRHCSSIGVCDHKQKCVCPSTAAGDYCQYANACPDGCRNRGTCVAHKNETAPAGVSGNCVCRYGFTGVLCETSVCACENGGTCTVIANTTSPVGLSGSCSCPTYFTGSLCEHNENPCVVHPCPANATCTIHSPGSPATAFAVCTCAAGDTSARCATTASCTEAASTACQNGGTCVRHVQQGSVSEPDASLFFTCTCPYATSGAHCETLLDFCDAQLDDCAVSGVCNATTRRCDCYEDRFTGLFCQLSSPCVSSPCANGGTCVINSSVALTTATTMPVVAEAFACVCGEFFEGAYCETGISPCLSSPCSPPLYCQGIRNATSGSMSFSCLPDMCLSSPCQNAGTCVPHRNGFTCVCLHGSSGALCEESYCDTQQNVCANGATCVIVPLLSATQRAILTASANKIFYGGYACVCPVTHYGQQCDDIAQCGLYCDHATCSSNSGPCPCDPGWVGPACTLVNPCKAQTVCQNGGECSVSNPSSLAAIEVHCACPCGYTGAYCETTVESPCVSSPCALGSTCVAIDCNSTFECHCLRSQAGSRCEQDNLCASNPCVHGNCTLGVNSYVCMCASDIYSGVHCDEVHPCLSNPCLNAGTCIAQGNGTAQASFTCACSRITTGVVCETAIPCVSNPCLNGGSCDGSVSPFQPFDPYCICAQLYSGNLCEQYDWCHSNPCHNSVGCVSTLSGYYCQCRRGFTGTLCDTNDLCSTQPCQNAGTCTNVGALSYACACVVGYEGSQCESVVPPKSCSTNSECPNGFCTMGICQCMSCFYGPGCTAVVDGVSPCSAFTCNNGGGSCNTGSQGICTCASSGHHNERSILIAILVIVVIIVVILTILAVVLVRRQRRRRAEKHGSVAMQRLVDEDNPDGVAGVYANDGDTASLLPPT